MHCVFGVAVRLSLRVRELLLVANVYGSTLRKMQTAVGMQTVVGA